MSNKCKETINDVEDIFIKENKGTIRILRLFDLKIVLLLTIEFSKSQRQVFECGSYLLCLASSFYHMVEGN